jgi:dihydropteroate synthase
MPRHRPAAARDGVDMGSALVAGTPALGRCLVMAVLNVTPDSFSDGGHWSDPDAAISRGLALLEQGVDIIDVGGESTRPGATRPPTEVELQRVIPVVDGRTRAGAFVSVDTMRASVAKAALDHGANMVNDVSGGLADPEMAALVAEADEPYVVMHWRTHAHAMAGHAVYDDIVGDVVDELSRRCSAVVEAGVSPDRLVVDPGLGFAKEASHNWHLLARLGALGFPVLVGASRKRFLASVATHAGNELDARARDDATAAVSTLAAAAGAWCVRVHEPRPSANAVRVVARIAAARGAHRSATPAARDRIPVGWTRTGGSWRSNSGSEL